MITSHVGYTDSEEVLRLRRKRYFLTHVLPVLLWMGLIFFFSSCDGERVGTWAAAVMKPFVPSTSFPDEIPSFLLFKSAHFAEYAILALLLLRALWPMFTTHAAYLTAAAISILYAISDEWHQAFTPGRTPSLRDVCIDTCGILTGLLLVFLISLYRRMQHSS